MEYIITYTESSKAKVIKHAAGSLDAVIALCELKGFADYKVFADVQELLEEVERLKQLVENSTLMASDLGQAILPAAPMQGEECDEIAQHKNAPVKVYLLHKRFIPADPTFDRYSDRIDFALEFVNCSSGVIRALKGDLVFKDLFHAEVFRIGLTVNNMIKPGDTSKWEGGFEYNQFLAEHQHFRQFEAEDLKVSLDNLQVAGAERDV